MRLVTSSFTRGAAPSRSASIGAPGSEMLEVVEHQQLLAGAGEAAERFGRGRAGLRRAAERVQHAIRNAGGIG